jgi:very-short-patch-repair endonuclease
MNDLGITVLRFRDEEVYHHMQSVLLEVERFMDDFEARNKSS